MSDGAAMFSPGTLLAASAGALVVCALIYILLSLVVGARSALGRVGAERVAEEHGIGSTLRPGSRDRITVDTVRHLALGLAVASATVAALELSPAIRAIAATLLLVAAGRMAEIVVAPRDPVRFLRMGGPFVVVLDRMLGPLVSPLARGWSLLVARHRGAVAPSRVERLEELREEQMEELIRDSELEGLLEREQGDLIREIVDTGSMVVREVMTPRTDIDAIPAELSVREMTAAFVSSRHSRLPVYEGSLDRVVGVVALRDLLPLVVRNEQEISARDVMRPVSLVPGGKKVLELLRELQQARQQLAVVVDEYGGTAGLVTLEDLIEEIVGEIHDEHEVAVEELQPDGQGGWLVNAMLPVDDLEDLIETRLADDGVDTVGGFVFSRLGRVPRVGDSIAAAGGIRMTVVRTRGRRILTVRVAQDSSASAPEADGENRG